MGRKHHTEEQIIGILRAAEVNVSKGGTIDALCRDLPHIARSQDPD